MVRDGARAPPHHEDYPAVKFAVIARSSCDEAIHTFFVDAWIASLSCHRARIRATRWLAMTGEASCQMPRHLRPRFQRSALFGDDFGDALRRKIHVDETGRGVGDLVIFLNLAVAQQHDRDALEHRPRAPGLRQRRAVAER